jgi:DNA-binding transcriptional LysR family regulator
MDLRDLLDVKAICEAGSFRKAAETLGVTQPTLSNRIAYLEDKLGAQLFEREHGRSRPTQLAEMISARAAAIGQDATLLTKDIRRVASGRTGVVRIGLGPAPSRTMLSKAVERITAEHPELSLALVFGSTSQLEQQLRDRDLDIVVCHTMAADTQVIQIEQEIEVENIVVAHPEHAMFKGPEPTLDQVILEYPMAIPVLEKRYVDIVSSRYGIDVTRLTGSVICSDFDLLLRLVMNRPWYFTAGPNFAFLPELASGRLRRLATPVPFKHRVAVHTNREALPLPAVANVQRIIRDVFPTILADRA